jgi:hypothetical protein
MRLVWKGCTPRRCNILLELRYSVSKGIIYKKREKMKYFEYLMIWCYFLTSTTNNLS